MALEDRWPPVYDEEELEETIKKLSEDGPGRWMFGLVQGSVFQGDIVSMQSKLPFINADGQATAVNATNLWLVVGNTCDLARNEQQVPNTGIVPIISFPIEEVKNRLPAINRYQTVRQFLVPAWNDQDGKTIMLADLTQICSVKKAALLNVGNVQARLNFQGWLLLHSCLVRFLARSDGRHD